MPTCYELANCPMDNFFSWASAPYMDILGDFALPIVWGFVISLIYFKSENSSLTLIVGIFLLTALVETNSWLSTSSNILYFWAIAIAAVAFGCSMFYMFKVRSQAVTA